MSVSPAATAHRHSTDEGLSLSCRLSRGATHLPVLLLMLGVLLWAWTFAGLAVARHEAGGTHAEDLGFTEQVIWNFLRGQWFRVGERWAMPIFHPAYLLRNPSRDPGSPKAQMWQDIKEVRRKYDELLGGKSG